MYLISDTTSENDFDPKMFPKLIQNASQIAQNSIQIPMKNHPQSDR